MARYVDRSNYPLYFGWAGIVLWFLATRLSTLSNVIVSYVHPRPAISNAILALSFLDHGLSAYTFRTYAESSGGLHLFALGSTPFVSLIGPEGIRAFAILLNAFTIIAVYAITCRLYSARISIVAAGILTLSPMFQFFASGAFPVSFELFASTIVIYSFIRYWEAGARSWFILSVVFLVLAIFDHAWAALVLLPLVGVSLTERNLFAVLTYLTIGAISTVSVYFITNISGGGRTFEAYSIFYNPEIILDPGFYIQIGYSSLGFALSPVLAAIAIVAALYYLLNQDHLLIALWTIAGLSPVMIFPRGASIHFYYLWGFLVPGSIIVAVALFELAKWGSDVSPLSVSSINRLAGIEVAGAVCLLITASFIVGPAGIVYPPADGADRLLNGQCVEKTMQSYNIDSEEVAVVTELNVGAREESSTEYLHTYLLYGGLYMQAPNSPSIHENLSSAKQAGAELIIDFRDTYVTTEVEKEPSILRESNGIYSPMCKT